MTIDELKAEAAAQGYSLIRKQPTVKFKPCPCGRKYPAHWYGPDGVFYRCPNCDLTAAPAKTNQQAKINWNRMVEDAGKP